MSVTKAQLVGGVGISTVGDLTVFGAVNASGSVTASSFVGNLTGTASTATASATSFGLSGTPNVTVGVVTATSVSVSGNVSIAGTLTYEDVTNVDSIGIVTARAGVNVTGGSVVISSGGLTVSGVTTVAAGSAGAPSVSPTGDNNTGIFFPSADTIAFAEGGVEAARFDSSGRLGIGTASISDLLHLGNSSTTSRTTIRVQTGNAYSDPGSVSYSNSLSSVGSRFAIDGTSNGYIGQFGVGNSANLWIGSWNNGATHGSIQFVTGNNTTSNVRATISSTGGFSVGTAADPGAGAIFATGDITAFYSSDIRLKKDIEPISEPIKKLMEISGVTYKWNEEYLKDKEVDGYFVRETEVGVIAQEVEKVLPEVVATRENGYKAVRYEKLVALLIEAVKDQQHQIDELKARLEEI